MKRPLRPSPLSRTLALVPPAIALVAQHASAAFDVFIKIGDINGESVDEKHPRWIELNEVQWNVKRPVTLIPGREREISPPSISELTITKPIDSASPELFLNAVGGGTKEFGLVTLEFVNTATRKVFYRLTLENVVVSSQAHQGAAGGELPQETVSLNFTKIKIEYFKMDPKTGDMIASPPVGYDLSTGEQF